MIQNECWLTKFNSICKKYKPFSNFKRF